MRLALEEGCLKAGQRYWACFALRQVTSKLSADSMARLFTVDSMHSAPVEEGALLLVSKAHISAARALLSCGKARSLIRVRISLCRRRYTTPCWTSQTFPSTWTNLLVSHGSRIFAPDT